MTRDEKLKILKGDTAEPPTREEAVAILKGDQPQESENKGFLKELDEFLMAGAQGIVKGAVSIPGLPGDIQQLSSKIPVQYKANPAVASLLWGFDALPQLPTSGDVLGAYERNVLRDLGGDLLCQKDSFLCAAKGVSIGIAFTKRFGAGLFGGEGFILQRLQGDGWAFVHAGGTLEEKTLAPGETLRVDTGCLVAFQPSVAYDIQFVGGIKTAIFGGEGLFFAQLTGPGRVWLQSLPFSRLASRIFAAAPQAGGRRREEGSLLGGLGNLLDGDGR